MVAAVITLAIGFVAGYFVHSQPKKPLGILDAYERSLPDSAKLNREQRASSEKIAIAIVLGETRADGMTYGEFAKLRAKGKCSFLNPKGFEYVASPSGAFPPNWVWVWDVYQMFDREKYPHPCLDVPAQLAAVYSDTGKVFPVDSELGEVGVNLGRNGPSPTAPTKASWLIDFRAGRAP
jgi:hypothetical protein